MRTIGRIDKIDIPEFGLVNIPAKIDTGANRSAIHCSEIHCEEVEGIEEITFHIPLDTSHGINIFHSKSFFKKRIRSSSGHLEERYVIKTTIVLFGMEIATTFSLTDRTEMKYPILLGRKLLRSRFIVDVSQDNLSFLNKTQS
ncbi:MAG: ATP-dependent zinc protease [Cyclobacteriaceae bacterium]